MATPEALAEQTAAGALALILEGTDPWLAIGQLVDGWHRADRETRPLLVQSPPRLVPGESRRWYALIAAAVEWLSAEDGLPFPPWTSDPATRLPEPWFLYPGPRLRAWQLVETPAPFKARNIFGGDRILARV